MSMFRQMRGTKKVISSYTDTKVMRLIEGHTNQAKIFRRLRERKIKWDLKKDTPSDTTPS